MIMPSAPLQTSEIMFQGISLRCKKSVSSCHDEMMGNPARCGISGSGMSFPSIIDIDKELQDSVFADLQFEL